MQFDAFLSGSGQARDSQWAFDVCRNLIPIPMLPPTKGRPGQWALQGTPGHSTFLTLPTAGPVDLFEWDGRLWAASRTKLYEVFENGTATERGDIDGTSERTLFATNGDLNDELMLVGNGRVFILDLSANTVAEVTDIDLPPSPIGPEYIDGYFILSARDALQFNLSDLLDGTSWSGLDAAEKSSTSDRLVRVKQDQGLLWLFGRKHIELWHNNGDPSFPWTPVDNVIINQGLAALDAIVIAGLENKTLCWLGSNGDGGPVAYQANGYQPQRISTEREEHVWQGYAETLGVTDAYMWSYQLDGQTFVVLDFPTVGRTWVCNLATRLWHEWSYFNPATSGEERCLGRSHAYLWGKHYVGSRDDTGRIFRMGPGIYEDAGGLIVRTRQAPYLVAEDYGLVHARFALDMRQGHVAANVAPGTASLRWSDNAGRTWSQPWAKDLGPTGDYAYPMEWHGLGYSEKGRGYWLTIASRNFVSITGCYLDVGRAA